MLTTITDGIFAAHHDLFLPGGVHFPCRMTVIRMTDGSLLLHSPTPIDDELARAIAERGEVGHIVAPSCLHHLYLGAASERYPAARVYAVSGIDRKQPDVSITDPLTGACPDAWRDDFATVAIAGIPKVNEVVMIHKPTRTALVIDLVFNVIEYRNIRTSLLFRTVGAHKKLAQSRMWRFLTSDRKAAGKSVDEFLAHDFDRLIPGHGEVVEGDARERLRAAIRWPLAS